ncbi:nucleotidyltransferase domain-containing protein [Coraliomargarita algicola]|uniref:Nucleotidyltransferase domain-containing protein n=1 Tax=Coraliomargarita algicola TaxID=3092156 RepID=A0ABZ0RL84_9BACT|nr:nucleotidyltransferase domain-containing protein [Coraliomargarita sp. J2-16]WPJ96975.1 nucleotidyltransferase domain-containing protein [Coraliomargarita sp. J2-16]
MLIDDRFRANAHDLCKQFGISRLCVFGSIARGEETSRSDIDFLAEFAAPSPATMPDRYLGFIEEAQKRFKRPVQLMTPRMIRNPHLKRSIERDLTVIHE